MADLNQVTIIGRLARDPDLMYTQKGTPRLYVTLANNTGFGENEQTNWISGVAYGPVAETMAKYLVKGSRIAIQGELTTYQKEVKNSEYKQTITQVRIASFYFLDSKKDNTSGAPIKREAPKKEDPDENPWSDEYNISAYDAFDESKF